MGASLNGVSRSAFSSDQFPKHLDDRARLRRWQDFVEENYGSINMGFAPDRPFLVRVEQARFGPVVVDRFQASLVRSARTARQIAGDGNDDFLIGLNCGRGPVIHRQLGRETELAAGSLMLLSNAEPAEVKAEAGISCLSVYISRTHLLELVNNAEDLVARRIDVEPEVLRYLHRYLRHLISAEDDLGHPLIADHVAATLQDLVATALEAGRDRSEIRRMRGLRGLRGARLFDILAEIKVSFDNPAFSASNLAAKLGLTPRYVQDLLQETGRTFSERVLELRLQKARTMLADQRHDKLKVSEIAYACGFNEVSYFNRCFRARFGTSPMHYRGNGEA